MPKAPVLDRTLYYFRLRDGTFRLCPWALVNTSIGALMEAVPTRREGGNITNEDVYDSSFNRILEINGDQLVTLLGCSGEQWPVDFNTQ